MQTEGDSSPKDAATPSTKARGKQRQLDQERADTVLIFLPRRSHRQRSGSRRWPHHWHKKEKGQTARRLLGWYIEPSKAENVSVIVIAGAAGDERSMQAEPSNESSNPRLEFVGSLEESSAEAKVSSDVNGLASSQKDSLTFRVFVSIQYDGDQVHLKSLRLPLMEASASCAIQIIEYTPPDPEKMQFFSIEPMILPSASHLGSAMGISASRNKDLILSTKLENLIRLDPLRFKDLAHEYSTGKAPGEVFRAAIALINRSKHAIDYTGVKPRNRAETREDAASDALLGASSTIATPIRAIAYILTLDIAHVSICSMSLAARQLHLRLSQLLAWPALGMKLRSQRLQEQVSIGIIAPQYTAMYNGIWLVGNDLILGQAFGGWLIDNHQKLAALMSPHLAPLLTDNLVQILAWLDSWPAGVKLNSQLSRFFRDVFTVMTKISGDAIVHFLCDNDSINLQRIFYALGLATRYLGLSMLLALVVDAIRLLTLHMTIAYLVQRAIFAFFCSSLRSLFHLFRGKKRNPLRSMRVDAAAYELDQLLLGTLFFTLFAFLWLTVAVFYAQFSALRLAIVAIVICLQTAITMLNHLPLFALVLRLKDPVRLPAGISLRLSSSKASRAQDHVQESGRLHCTHFELTSTPLSVADIFRGYYNHLDGLRSLPFRIVDVIRGRKT